MIKETKNQLKSDRTPKKFSPAMARNVVSQERDTSLANSEAILPMREVKILRQVEDEVRTGYQHGTMHESREQQEVAKGFRHIVTEKDEKARWIAVRLMQRQ